MRKPRFSPSWIISKKKTCRKTKEWKTRRNWVLDKSIIGVDVGGTNIGLGKEWKKLNQSIVFIIMLLAYKGSVKFAIRFLYWFCFDVWPRFIFFFSIKSQKLPKMASKRAEGAIIAIMSTFCAKESFSAIYGPFWLKFNFFFSSRRVLALQRVKLSKIDFRLTENVRYFWPHGRFWAKIGKMVISRLLGGLQRADGAKCHLQEKIFLPIFFFSLLALFTKKSQIQGQKSAKSAKWPLPGAPMRSNINFLSFCRI